MAEVGAIFHLLGEDVAGVALARDMEDLDGAVLNPFVGAVSTEFQMADVLHGGGVGPDDGGGVVIVDAGRFGVINEESSSHIKAIGQVADGDGKLGTFAGGKDFGFIRAERCLFLAYGFPRYGIPMRYMMALLMLLNLKSGIAILWGMALPSYEPQ